MSEGAILILTATILFLVLTGGLLLFMFRFQTKAIGYERELVKAIIKSQEKDRSRLSVELHDGLGIDILVTKNYLGSMQKVFSEYNLGSGKIDALQSMLEDIYQTQRRIAHNLMPSNLEKHGLIEALKELVKRINEGGELKAAFTSNGDYIRMEADRELMVYRIVQEFSHNTMKHARASLLKLEVDASAQGLKLILEDNGIGFDVDKFSSTGLGMKSILSRIKLLNALYQMTSTPALGTRTEIFVPLKD